MLEIRSILAPTDFSQHAASGLRYACGLAERFEATLHLLHVLPEVIAPIGPEPMLVPTIPAEYYREAEQTALQALETALLPEFGKPAQVRRTVHWGDPVLAITQYAREQSIELIVISTHGRTGLSHVLLGSVAERIVREAPCPVLTVRDPRRD
ncbi:MAG: universal stress protein A [Isosphaeraceae bacterium]|jgi:nucleotide-binding universal stress UspA family protein|nr:MAG: universal stress protein A [Isosphaeraceae bacterium]